MPGREPSSGRTIDKPLRSGDNTATGKQAATAFLRCFPCASNSDRWNNCGWRRCCAVLLFCAAAVAASSAQFTTLVEFKGPNGGHPLNLTQGFDGDLYGTTLIGGTHREAGTVFKMTTAGKLKTIYNFCSVHRGGQCDDGDEPLVGVTLGTDGSLYRSNAAGGTNHANLGTLFSITEDGQFATLFDFPGFPNGWDPYGMVHAANGNFFGSTYYGGPNCPNQEGCGTFYEMTPEGSLTTLHNFCSRSNCSDGMFPNATPVQGINGNFYGTTVGGGAVCCGVIYEITPSGTLTTLHSFNGSDGAQPTTLIQGSDGNFYGTTVSGGSNNLGTFFKMTPKGAN